jgi:LydA holin phage, holin superfamily III
MTDWLKHLEPIQFIYGTIAVAGGIARYLNSYVQGKPFNVGIFFASAFTAGFSGYMFALLGLTMNLPPTMLFVIAGTGGFFGEQTMKLVLESVSTKIN